MRFPEILGMNQGHTAIILGAGNLGRALIQNFQFSQNGFRLTAAFDTDSAVVGKSIAGGAGLLHRYAGRVPVPASHQRWGA